MSNFWERLLGRVNVRGSGQQAKDRLQFVLLHDRLNMSPERMEAMKREILDVISKYVSIDSDNVDIALQRRESASLLIAEVPFIKTVESIDDDEAPEPAPAPPVKKPRRKKTAPPPEPEDPHEDNA